jgi:hypothetical protein
MLYCSGSAVLPGLFRLGACVAFEGSVCCICGVAPVEVCLVLHVLLCQCCMFHCLPL